MSFVIDTEDRDGYRELREVDANGTERILAWIRFDGGAFLRDSNARLLLDALNGAQFGYEENDALSSIQPQVSDISGMEVGETYRYLVYPHDRWFTAILEWNEDEEDYVLQTYGEDAEYWGEDATYCVVSQADTIEELEECRSCKGSGTSDCYALDEDGCPTDYYAPCPDCEVMA